MSHPDIIAKIRAAAAKTTQSEWRAPEGEPCRIDAVGSRGRDGAVASYMAIGHFINRENAAFAVIARNHILALCDAAERMLLLEAWTGPEPQAVVLAERDTLQNQKDVLLLHLRELASMVGIGGATPLAEDEIAEEAARRIGVLEHERDAYRAEVERLRDLIRNAHKHRAILTESFLHEALAP